MRLNQILSFFSQLNTSIAYTAGGLEWQGWFTLVVFVATLVALIKEAMPPDIVLVVSAGILVMAGIITPSEFLSGFAKDIIVTIAMLCIIVRTLELNGILHMMGKHIFPTGKSVSRSMATLLVPVGAMSAFFNNTPIILMLTPMIRQWSLTEKMSPSTFLIPISYIAILGGMCTLIGTSTNLIVDGLLRTNFPTESFGFFELGKIGLFLAVIGLFYLTFIGHRLLPARQDPTTTAIEETRKFTLEMLVEEGCPFAQKPIGEIKELADKQLIEIQRSYRTIDSPGPEDVILVGDRLIFAGDISQIAEIHAIQGLVSTADPHFDLKPSSSHFSEIVISTTSSFIGRTLKQLQFRKNYGASVLAVYRQGERVSGAVADIVLQPGDTLMVLSSEPWRAAETLRTDFFTIRHDEKVISFSLWQATFILAVLAGMVLAAALGVQMMIASLGAGLIYILTKSIGVKEVQRSIRWNVLILIGSAFSFGHALQVTGVAQAFASFVLSIVGFHPRLIVAALFLVTMLISEVVTNNAAALILFPIAIETIHLAGFGSPQAAKAIAVTIAIAASASFLTPIGYQTNTIVYGPGGYRFTDYFRIGLPLTILVFVLSVILIPIFWPFF